jgi:hypothetical protein
MASASRICLAHLICNALVPNTLARSYLVMYGVVVLFSVEIFLLLTLLTVLVPPPCSPLVTILFWWAS